MNRKTKILNRQNNKLDELISDENQEVFTDIICYLRNSDLSDYNIEVVRNDITTMVLDGQKRGDSIEQVIGGDYREFCDSIIDTFPKKTLIEKLLETTDLICFCMAILLTIHLLLSKETIDIIKNLVTKQPIDFTYTISLGTVMGMVAIMIAAVLLVKAILDNIFSGKEKKKPVGSMVLFAVIIALLIASVFVKMPLFSINILVAIAMIIVLYGAHFIISGMGD